jgi:GDP-mannose 6-dehydrogenase
VHIDHALDVILERGPRPVGMLGLSFKAGTDDLRESPLVTLAERLIGKGFQLRIYDPDVSLSLLIGANQRYIETTIPHIASLMCFSMKEMVEFSDTIVVGLAQAHLVAELESLRRPGQFVLDLVRLPDTPKWQPGYRGVCW